MERQVPQDLKVNVVPQEREVLMAAQVKTVFVEWMVCQDNLVPQDQWATQGPLVFLAWLD